MGKTTFFTSVGDQTIPVTPTAIGDGSLPGSFTQLDCLTATAQAAAAMSTTQAANPQAGSFTSLSCTTLTTTALNALAAAPASTLTTTQIAALTTTQLAGFTTTQISALNALFVAKLGAP